MKAHSDTLITILNKQILMIKRKLLCLSNSSQKHAKKKQFFARRKPFILRPHDGKAPWECKLVFVRILFYHWWRWDTEPCVHNRKGLFVCRLMCNSVRVRVVRSEENGQSEPTYWNEKMVWISWGVVAHSCERNISVTSACDPGLTCP